MKTNNNEVWRAIPDFEGRYLVSNYAKVVAVERTLKMKNGNYDLELDAHEAYQNYLKKIL